MTEEIRVTSEWDGLEEVFVGIVPDEVVLPPLSYSMYHYVTAETRELLKEAAGKRAAEVIPDAIEGTRDQIDGLAALYERHGVKVNRPRPWTEDEERFLAYVAPGGLPLYTRDPIAVIGNNVIELSLMAPYRRKEIFAMRDTLVERVADDPKARYLSMPKPQPFQITREAPEGPGPFLEGGDVFVLGKDVLVGNSGLASNEAGIGWLRRYLSNDGYAVHEVPLTRRWLHLDCVFAVVRPGLGIWVPDEFPQGPPAPISDWELIEATAEEAHRLGVNTMCLRSNSVVIGAEHERLIGELQNHDAEAVTTPMDVAAQWGGGIRCASHPLRRSS